MRCEVKRRFISEQMYCCVVANQKLICRVQRPSLVWLKHNPNMAPAPSLQAWAVPSRDTVSGICNKCTVVVDRPGLLIGLDWTKRSLRNKYVEVELVQDISQCSQFIARGQPFLPYFGNALGPEANKTSMTSEITSQHKVGRQHPILV